MPPRRKQSNQHSLWYIAPGIAILTFIATGAMNSFSLAQKVATVPYVDERFLAAQKYTDSSIENIKKEVIAHSDANHQDMVIRLEQAKTDSKESFAKVTTTMDLLIRAVEDKRRSRP